MKWAVLASVRFFSQVPPIRLRPRRSPTGTENFEAPHQKFREKTLGRATLLIVCVHVGMNYSKCFFFIVP